MTFGGTKLTLPGMRPVLPPLHELLWWMLAGVIALLGAALFWAIVGSPNCRQFRTIGFTPGTFFLLDYASKS